MKFIKDKQLDVQLLIASMNNGPAGVLKVGLQRTDRFETPQDAIERMGQILNQGEDYINELTVEMMTLGAQKPKK